MSINMLDGIEYESLPEDTTVEGDDPCRSLGSYHETTVLCTVDNQPGHVVHMAGDGTKIISMWRGDQ